ncbi:hypothetical protein AJ80_07849 [Polytolypa hystricis UAMH7299]|uniref:Mid2 domain-containing protein n=1 Tax=Polytolypa hystricis (strain UAMH7299) TaxID=1447883 RepID=A0A2B7XHZ0_POLH7|nr:hypothetical protein AJ80_07849 [Polytolypa hystricis UAMH7299]
MASFDSGMVKDIHGDATCVTMTIIETSPDVLPTATQIFCAENWSASTIYRQLSSSIISSADEPTSSPRNRSPTPTPTSTPEPTSSKTPGAQPPSQTSSSSSLSSSSSSKAWIGGVVVGSVIIILITGTAALIYYQRWKKPEVIEITRPKDIKPLVPMPPGRARLRSRRRYGVIDPPIFAVELPPEKSMNHNRTLWVDDDTAWRSKPFSAHTISTPFFALMGKNGKKPNIPESIALSTHTKSQELRLAYPSPSE